MRVISPATGHSQNLHLSLLDSGADDTIMPLTVATVLGVALLPSPSSYGIRWGRTSYPIRYGEVEFELTDGLTTCCWRAVVAFTTAAVRYPLLGVAGFLEFFDTTFLWAARIAGLQANAAYPGSIS